MSEHKLAVLLAARDIPLRADVTRRTGQKIYCLVDRIRIFNKTGTPKEIKAEDGAFFLTSKNGDFNVIGADTLLLWRVSKAVLMDYLQGEDIEYETWP